MVHLIGDNLAVSLPQTSEDLFLYIDISHRDLAELQTHVPINTYILTTRPLVQCKPLLDAGFFNLLYGVDPKTITMKTLLGFLDTKLVDNQLKLAIDELIPIYERSKTNIGCVTALLDSIRQADIKQYQSLIRHNLSSMQDAMKDIELAYALAKPFSQNPDAIADLNKTKQDLSVAEAAMAKKDEINQKLTVKLTEISVQLKTLQQQYAEAQSQLAEMASNTVEMSKIESTDSFLALQAENTKLKEELAVIQAENNTFRSTSGITISGDLDSKDRLILELRKSLDDAINSNWSETMSAQLPAITDAVSLKARKILYLKEVRKMPYTIGLVRYYDKIVETMSKDSKFTTLILVFDPLINQFMVEKYSSPYLNSPDKEKSRKWAINSQPVAGSRVVVTNIVSMDFLKGVLKIDQYDYLIVVDCFGLYKDVIDTPATERFYLVATVNDYQTFGLDPNRCIGFIDTSNSQLQSPYAFNVAPWDTRLTLMDSTARGYKFLKDGCWQDILRRVGIIYE